MINEPQIDKLSFKNRQYFFWILVVVFFVSLPALIFYTTGYRLNFENEETSIVTTGGVYVTTGNLEVDVYLDNVQVEKPRLFRSAYYIQHIHEGQHRVVVQRPDLQTWVKELPIDSYLVIEVSAFNMPLVPHIRPVTEHLTAAGTLAYLGIASTTDLFSGVSTTVPVLKVSGTESIGYLPNEEYVFVKSLFSSTSITSDRSVFEKIMDGIDRFRFSTTTELEEGVATSSVELVVQSGDVSLREGKGELYAVWLGSVENIPYYYCVTENSLVPIATRYGTHVADEIERFKLSTTTPLIVDDERICRPEIKINNLRQDVYFYDFFPGSTDLILLQLEDGLYVTEVDDRAWQNTQLIYPGIDFQVVVENNTIFIHEDEKYFELITKI